MKSYKDLIVWQKGLDLCVRVYQITDSFPKSEIYGLTSQIRRSVVSIPSNIAEGHSRGKKEFIQFLRIAFGSGAELETQLLIALKIKYITEEDYEELNLLLVEILKMLNKLISVLLFPNRLTV